MSTVWIRVAYGAVVALLVAFTVVFGIAMVSPGPRPPGDPGITFRQLSGNGSGGATRTSFRRRSSSSSAMPAASAASFPSISATCSWPPPGSAFS